MGESKKDFERRKLAAKRTKKAKRIGKLVILYLFVAVFCVSGIWLTVVLYDRFKGKNVSGVTSDLSALQSQPQLSTDSAVQKLLSVNLPDSVEVNHLEVGKGRSGAKLSDFTGIVIHYTGDSGSDATERREVYLGGEVSAHFVVGFDGKTQMCLPLDEQANIVGGRNSDTISIEYCHNSVDGLMEDETYEALVDLCATLLKASGKGTDYLLRHYDINKSADCPPYYITHTEKWDEFKSDVEAKMQK